MSDRKDFYYKQRVSEAELDGAFDQIETAIWDLVVDLEATGITSGMVASESSPTALTIEVTSGVGYDDAGKRVYSGTDQTIDVSQDYTGVNSEPTQAFYERYVSVFVKRLLVESDPRLDGNNDSVNFQIEESSEFIVRMAPEAPSGSGTRVAIPRSGEILVCDVIRYPGQTVIVDAEIYTDRREDLLFLDAANIPVTAGSWSTLDTGSVTIQDVLDDIDTLLTGHFAGTADRHAATDVTASAAGYDVLSGTTVQAQLTAVDAEFEKGLRSFDTLYEALDTLDLTQNARRQLFSVRWGRALNGFAVKVRGAIDTETISGGALSDVCSDGRHVYFADGDYVRARRTDDLSTSVFDVQPQSGNNVVAIGCDGLYCYAITGGATATLFQLNPDTGATVNSTSGGGLTPKAVKSSRDWIVFAEGNYLRWANKALTAGGALNHGASTRDVAIYATFAYLAAVANGVNDVRAHNVSTDTAVWSVDLGTTGTPSLNGIACDDQYVFVGGDQDTIGADDVNLWCLNRETGSTIWYKYLSSASANDEIRAVEIDDEYIWIVFDDGEFVICDKRNGEILQYGASALGESGGYNHIGTDGEAMYLSNGATQLARVIGGRQGQKFFQVSDNLDSFGEWFYRAAVPLDRR